MGFLDKLVDGFTGGLGTLASSAIGLLGGKETNETNMGLNSAQMAFNAEEAQKSRDFNSWQADKSMAFSERMANSEWQRGVQDMEAAGINPMLAIAKGGNSAPSGQMGGGATASSGSMIPMQNKVAAAMQNASSAAQIQNVQSATEVNQAQADKIRAETTTTNALSGKYSQETENLRTQQTETYARIDNINKDTLNKEDQAKLMRAQKFVADSQAALNTAGTNRTIKDTDKIEAETALAKANELLRQLDVPEASANAEFYKTPMGKNTPAMNAGAGLVGKAISSAVGLRNISRR